MNDVTERVYIRVEWKKISLGYSVYTLSIVEIYIAH